MSFFPIPDYLCNIKILRLISVYLSGLILCLHSFIPHEHDRVPELVLDQPVQHEFDFFGLLKGLFNTDLGEDHLEYFAKAATHNTVSQADQQDLFPSPFIQALPRLPEYEPIGTLLFTDPGPPIDTGIKFDLTLRGPPGMI